MARYRKKPVEVDAEQFWPDKPFPAGVYTLGPSIPGGNDERYLVRALGGRVQVQPGDWIITGITGERYPCKPDIFDETYELVEPPEEPEP